MLKLIKIPDNLLKYAIAAVIMAVPLYPKFPFIGIPGTYVSIRLEDFLIAALTVVFILHFLPKIRGLVKNDIEKSILIYLGVGIVSVLSGIFLTKTISPHLGILHWLRRVEYFLPFFIGVIYFKEKGRKDIEFFLKVLMLVIPILFLYGFGQKHLSWPVIITQNEEYSKGVALRWVPGSHVNSTFAGHYDLATFLVLTLPLFITFFFTLEGKWTKMSLLIVIFSGLWLLTNAVSRISVVSYLAASILSLILVRRYKAILLVVAVSFIFFVFSGDLLARYSSIIDVTYTKIKEKTKILSEYKGVVVYAQEENLLPKRRTNDNIEIIPKLIFEDRSTSIRLNVEWPRAIRAFRKNPLVGTGYSSITLATDNEYLRLLGEVGILGFFSFILIFSNIVILIKKVLGRIHDCEEIKKGFIAAFIGSLFGVFLNSLFIDIFEASKFAIIFWLFTGMFVSLARKLIYEQHS